MRVPPVFQRAALALATVFTPVPVAPPPAAPIVAAGAPPPDVAPALARILRPQAAYRWLLPQLAAITPQYIESILRGALTGDHVRAWELFDLMEDTWPRLRKNAMELKNGVRNLKPEFSEYTEEEDEPTPTATEKMKLVSAALRTMRPAAAADENALGGTISDIMDAWLKGVSVLEVDWQTAQAGKLGQIVAPRATFWVHPICYGWDSNGRLGLRASAGVVTTGYEQSVSAVADFPPEKFLVAIAKSKSGSALAGSLLRPLAWWWCASNFSADWLLNLAQVFGLPFRWANYDPNAPQATIDAICSMLQNMGSAGWAAFPAGTTLELKGEGQKADNSPQADMLDRADKNCDLLILGQTLTSDAGRSGKGGGSLALGKVHEGVKGDIITAAARFVVDVMENQLFPAILRLNYGEDSECPRFALATEKEEDLGAKAGVLVALAQAGAGERIGLDYISQTFDIPKPRPGERTLADVAAEAEQQAQAQKKPPTVYAPDDGEAVAGKLAEIAGIEDDEVFARELDAFGAAILAANSNHRPPGSPQGGQFAPKGLSTVKTRDEQRTAIAGALAAAANRTKAAFSLGRVPDALARRVAVETNGAREIGGHEMRIDSDFVRHAQRYHPNLTDADFHAIPELLGHADHVAADVTDRKLLAVRFESRLGDRDHRLIGAMLTGRGHLQLITLKKSAEGRAL